MMLMVCCELSTHPKLTLLNRKHDHSLIHADSTIGVIFYPERSTNRTGTLT